MSTSKWLTAPAALAMAFLAGPAAAQAVQGGGTRLFLGVQTLDVPYTR